MVHKALELFAAKETLPSRDTIAARADHLRTQLRRHGVPDRDLDRAVRTVQEALVRTLDDERGRWMFSAAQRMTGHAVTKKASFLTPILKKLQAATVRKRA